MNHPTEDELLLLAYGELAEPQAMAIESHIAACPVCADQLATGKHARSAAVRPEESSAVLIELSQSGR